MNTVLVVVLLVLAIAAIALSALALYFSSEAMSTSQKTLNEVRREIVRAYTVGGLDGADNPLDDQQSPLSFPDQKESFFLAAADARKPADAAKHQEPRSVKPIGSPEVQVQDTTTKERETLSTEAKKAAKAPKAAKAAEAAGTATDAQGPKATTTDSALDKKPVVAKPDDTQEDVPAKAIDHPSTGTPTSTISLKPEPSPAPAPAPVLSHEPDLPLYREPTPLVSQDFLPPFASTTSQTVDSLDQKDLEAEADYLEHMLSSFYQGDDMQDGLKSLVEMSDFFDNQEQSALKETWGNTDPFLR